MGSCLSTGISVVATVKGSPVNYKIIIVGDSGVGKSSVFLRYTKNQFDYLYKPTMSVCIESVVTPCLLPSHHQSSNHSMPHPGKNMPQAVVVSLWDLPGKDEVDLRKVYYKNLDGVIVVVEQGTELNTESVLRWKQDILDNMKDDSDNDNAATHITVPFLLLGSKQDKLSKEAQKMAAQHLKKIAFENDFIDGIPVSASNGDSSVHKAIQLLVQFMVEKTLGLHRDSAANAMKKAMAAKLIPHNLNLTDCQELDMTMVEFVKQLTLVEQQYEAFQKGQLKFRQNCVIAGITSTSLSSIEQCVLALRSSLMSDKEMLMYKMEDRFPELYLNHDSNNVTSTLPAAAELSHIISLYHSQVYTNGKQLLASLPVALKSCNSSLEQLATRIRPTTDEHPSNISSDESVTEGEQIENHILHNDNRKVLEQKQAMLNQWLSKVQGTSEKVLASMLWEDTNEA